MYNLAVLVQHGHPLPSRVGRLFDVSRHDGRDVVVEKILKRCFEMCVVSKVNNDHEYCLGDLRWFERLSVAVLVTVSVSLTVLEMMVNSSVQRLETGLEN